MSCARKTECSIPKLFPYGEEYRLMKLTRGKLLETLRLKNEGYTTYQARKVAHVSVRRVNQVWQEYVRSGEVPVIGKKNGRPKRRPTREEISLVRKAYQTYRCSASTLERCIERDSGIHLSHRLIHTILLMIDCAKHKDTKDVRKKTWIRYERRHSLTAVHIDWHQEGDVWVCAVTDDASRKILSLVEVSNATTDASINAMMLALEHGTIQQLITDHGCQFTSNNGGDSRFVQFLVEHNIKLILGRIKHPQTNGKLERLWREYKRHRWSFPSAKAFVRWYNTIRPHRSLNFDQLETPEQAFERKLKAEV
jgi:putative transposase